VVLAVLAVLAAPALESYGGKALEEMSERP